MKTPIENVEAIRAAMPREGLFAEKDWLISPTAFPLENEFVDELEKLGYRLGLFVRACNLLYQLSVRGKQPSWIADYLDRGKSPELIEFSRAQKFRDDLPRVLRPDLVLTESSPNSSQKNGAKKNAQFSFTIAELDNVPGGIGLTAWLNRVYASLGQDVIGGANGMIEGFRAILPDGADIIVSEEAATYRPEMEWLVHQLNNGSGEKKWRVADAANSNCKSLDAKTVYRFFELFDLANVPCASSLMNAALNDGVRITPPFKPYLEEKMWFALFWLRPLRNFWRRELSERHFLKLQQVVPYTWIVDPAPLPQHAVVPQLEINDWRELGKFSQKQRDLILKISGFSELAWGSRGVSLAADMPHHEWVAAVENALRQFASNPYILQRFHKGRLVEHPYFDPQKNVMRTMQGRVRLCPYYFRINGKTELRGALATVCPADKKLLHGMRDAILVPAATAVDF